MPAIKKNKLKGDEFEKVIPKNKHFSKKFKPQRENASVVNLSCAKQALNEGILEKSAKKKFKNKTRKYGYPAGSFALNKQEGEDNMNQTSRVNEILPGNNKQLKKKKSQVETHSLFRDTSEKDREQKESTNKRKKKNKSFKTNYALAGKVEKLEGETNNVKKRKRKKKNKNINKTDNVTPLEQNEKSVVKTNNTSKMKKRNKVNSETDNALAGQDIKLHVEISDTKKKRNKKNKTNNQPNNASIENEERIEVESNNKKKRKNNMGNSKTNNSEQEVERSDNDGSMNQESDNESTKSVSSFNADSYPSDSDDELDQKVPLRKSFADNSSDESSDNESQNSDASSHFDMDSYPSDTEEEEDNEKDLKRGLPVNAIPTEELKEREKRTIFVGNLPYSVERKDLKKWFYKFGKIECVRLRSAPISNPELPRKVAVIKKSFHENRTNIHAYIRFQTIEAANNAIQANGAVFKNHILRVDHSLHEGKYDPKKGIFVGNVPFSVEEDSLWSFFSECGEIDSVRIVRDKNTGVGKGFAYVNFKCTSAVPLALKLDGELLEKREIRIKPIKYIKKNALPFRSNPNLKHRFNKFSKSPKNKQKINKTNKFQGEMSKKRTEKYPKKKSFLEKKRETLSKILTNSSKKPQKKDK